MAYDKNTATWQFSTRPAVPEYQDANMRAADRASSVAAEVLFLHGQLLCSLSRQREAARPFARAWHLAARQDHQRSGLDTTVLPTACRADPDAFRDARRAETGTLLPDWLTSHDST